MRVVGGFAPKSGQEVVAGSARDPAPPPGRRGGGSAFSLGPSVSRQDESSCGKTQGGVRGEALAAVPPTPPGGVQGQSPWRGLEGEAPYRTSANRNAPAIPRAPPAPKTCAPVISSRQAAWRRGHSP